MTRGRDGVRGRIVAVDGVDGSGKSRFAAALAAACAADGVAVTLLHVDDFRRAVDFSGLDAEAEAARYYDAYYDLAALDARLAPFRADVDVDVDVDDDGDGGGALAIVEGVLTLRVPAVASAAALIALTVSSEEARRRILERDRAKGRSDEEIERRIARRYFPARARYVAACDPEARAAVVVDNDDWRAPRVIRRVRGGLPAPVERALGRLVAGMD